MLRIVCVIVVAWMLLSFARIGLITLVYSAVADWTTVRLGFDGDAAHLVAVIASAVFAMLLPTIAWALAGRKQMAGAFLIIGAHLMMFALVRSVGKSVCFDRRTGAPLCYVARTPVGQIVSRTKGWDPVYGVPFTPYTSDQATGKTGSDSLISKAIRESAASVHNVARESNASAQRVAWDSAAAAAAGRRSAAVRTRINDLRRDYDSIEVRFSALQENLMERTRFLGASGVLKPEISGGLAAIQRDLSAAAGALNQNDVDGAASRLDRARRQLKALESY